MNAQEQRVERRRTREFKAWHEAPRDFWSIASDVLGTLIVMAVIAFLLGALPLRAQAPADWPQADRTATGGVCTFAGRIEPGQVVQATCLTGLPPTASVVGTAESGSPLIDGWITDTAPQYVMVAFRNVLTIPIEARDLRVRVHLAPSVPVHPCNRLPANPVTPFEQCVARQCALGREPIVCHIPQTGAPAAGTAGAN